MFYSLLSDPCTFEISILFNTYYPMFNKKKSIIYYLDWLLNWLVKSKTLTQTRAVVLNGGWFCPPGDIWQRLGTLWESLLRGAVPLASSGSALPSSPQCTGPPHQVERPDPQCCCAHVQRGGNVVSGTWRHRIDTSSFSNSRATQWFQGTIYIKINVDLFCSRIQNLPGILR